MCGSMSVRDFKHGAVLRQCGRRAVVWAVRWVRVGCPGNVRVRWGRWVGVEVVGRS